MSEPRKVLMSEELFDQLGASRVDWGEPDAQGFYTPTVYVEVPHEHEWTDAPEDEELWYCPGCGRVETRDGELIREDGADR